ncbi:MAG TPA: OmpA family protein [Marinagarivorans sp.]
MTNKLFRLASVGVLGLAISGCATTPEPSDKTTELQNELMSAKQESYVQKYAPLAFEDAKKMIDKVKAMESEGASDEVVQHQQYLAEKKLDTAIELAKQKRSEEKVENAALNRNETLLTAQSKKLNEAEMKAETMAERAKMAEREAEQAREEAKAMSEKAEAMVAKLKDISAKDSDRGLVITIGSLLFEVDEAQLKPDSQNTVVRIADFLKQYPDRSVLVEGFTDSTGAETYNKILSEKRAKEVVALLKNNGIERQRLSSVGYGEQFPKAPNETKIGRQKNRRVELVVSHTDDSTVPHRTE